MRGPIIRMLTTTIIVNEWQVPVASIHHYLLSYKQRLEGYLQCVLPDNIVFVKCESINNVMFYNLYLKKHIINTHTAQICQSCLMHYVL